MDNNIYRAPDDWCYKAIFQIKIIDTELAKSEAVIKDAETLGINRILVEDKINSLKQSCDGLRKVKHQLQTILLNDYGITVA